MSLRTSSRDLGRDTLHAGRYSLRVYYPPRAEAVGEAEIKLELQYPELTERAM